MAPKRRATNLDTPVKDQIKAVYDWSRFQGLRTPIPEIGAFFGATKRQSYHAVSRHSRTQNRQPGPPPTLPKAHIGKSKDMVENHGRDGADALTPKSFSHLLSTRHTLILDGALATELEARGHNLAHPLWSGKILQEDPESIRQVHLDYFLHGADVAITASYQASTRGLEMHLGLDEAQGQALIRRSAELAQRAREEALKRSQSDGDDGDGNGEGRRSLVAGSVGPYGAFLADGSEYTGAYDLSSEEFKNFHRPRIAALVGAEVDLLAVETMPNVKEIRAVLDLLREEFAGAVCWVSCTLKSGSEISDGTALSEVAELVNGYREQVIAVGVNCVPPGLVKPALEALRLATDLPLVCYPNSGEMYDAANNTWLGSSALQGDAVVENFIAWRPLAQLLGGCCRTGPADIRNISAVSNSQS